MYNVLKCCVDVFTERTCDEVDEFDCNGDGSLCLPNHKVCDGKNDCQRREDEDPLLCHSKFFFRIWPLCGGFTVFHIKFDIYIIPIFIFYCFL